MYTFHYKDNVGDYVEYGRSTMSAFTELLKNSEVAPVQMKLSVDNSELEENQDLENIGLFVSDSSTYGSYGFLETNHDPETSVTSILNYPEGSGLLVSRIEEGQEVFVQFKFGQGSDESSRIVLVESLDGLEIPFKLKFIPDNSQENTRLFLGLEVSGLIVTGEG